ncbi:inositol-trisphosphate 3-kinase B isoform X3 [Hydra vulgaris]|uniref:Kinase n=1 Tax=Hydra vulgaris TaxID=6087 RepID=A0ABM4CK77_HYDVU
MSVHMLFCDINKDASNNHLKEEKINLHSYLECPVNQHPEIVVSNTSPQNSPSFQHLNTNDKSCSEFHQSLVNGTHKGRTERLYSIDNQSRPILGKRNASLISLSSVCSIDDMSDITDIDDLTTIEETKESLWLKLKKVVRWTPFIQNYTKPYPWIQLAGHSGGFISGKEGTVIKKSSEKEALCLQSLMSDVLRPYVPALKGLFVENEVTHIEMQDLLHGFSSSCFVMDCKMGIRTYLEEEVCKQGKARKDLYLKMISVDPSEPTDEENNTKSCTKSRYMIWREQLSSTSSLGFRIEGVKRGMNPPDTDFKKVSSAEDIGSLFAKFINYKRTLQEKYLQRLKAIRTTLECSEFFKKHEMIGSSLLFVHDETDTASIWMIDFGKTNLLDVGVSINHNSEWILGNREDGYLIGLDNIINIWSNMLL